MNEVEAKAKAERLLQKHWGHPSFRSGQWEVIWSVVQGQDNLAVLPTGGGKSLCYQMPALLLDGLALVVSPLIALMQDQVAGLKTRGISAAFINSALKASVRDQIWTDAEFGRYKLLYLSPERLHADVFKARAERLNVRLLAVDEAHCISEWGHNFRPEYLRIAEGRQLLNPRPTTLAVTATATPEVRRDILEQLALRAPSVRVKGFDRPNIVWSIFREVSKRAKVKEILDNVPGSGIIYAATRREVEEWAAWLNAEGYTAAFYHGGLPTDAREAVQENWIADKQRLMVATNAFGMGIDKPDVRVVIHVSLPSTLEAYYQEAGRAGRDGKRSYAILLFHAKDAQTPKELIDQSHPEAKALRAVYTAICNVAQLAIGSLPDQPVTVDIDAVARLTAFPPSKVKTAVRLLERQDVWQVVKGQKHYGLLRFTAPANVVRLYVDKLSNSSLAQFINALLRTVHADAFSGWWDFDLRILQKRTKLPRPRILKGLAFLEAQKLIRWHPPEAALRLQFTEPRSSNLPIDDTAIRRSRRRSMRLFEHMLRYARSVSCRRYFLLSYFGEASPERCGTCDVCLGRHRPVVITPDDEPVMRIILRQIERDVPRAEWFEELDADPLHVDGLIDWLVQEGYLRINDPFAETFAVTEKAITFMEQWGPRS